MRYPILTDTCNWLGTIEVRNDVRDGRPVEFEEISTEPVRFYRGAVTEETLEIRRITMVPVILQNWHPRKGKNHTFVLQVDSKDADAVRRLPGWKP